MTSTGPLAGLRVVELAGIGPTPFAGLLLAELGADVVRIDRPGPANPLDAGSGLARSRPSIAVDLKHPEGVETVLRLVVDADIFIEGLRPGVTERLGLGPDACLARNPRLIYGRMTGWGQDGPWAQRAGHDITYAALTGALSLIGTADRPVVPLNLVADFGGGTLYLLVGVLAALQARQTTGQGQVVDAAMVDGASSLLTMFHALAGAGLWSQPRGGNMLDGGLPFYDTYACADGRFVAVGALEPQFYAELLERLELRFATDQYDAAGFAWQRSEFARIFATKTRDEWAEAFAGSDACVAPVLTLDEAPKHPHLAARGTFAEVDGRPTPRVAPRFSDTPTGVPGREPVPGSDTRAYLLSHGFTETEVRDLIARGAVAEPVPGEDGQPAS